MALAESLRELDVPFMTDEPMKNHTTFQIGGPARLFITPRDFRELAAVIAACRREGEEPFMMGRGSNLLVKDEGVMRPVILLGEGFSQVRREGDALICQAGAQLTKVCRFAAGEHLGGMEWAFGIPGCIGGAVYMNAGAYGGEMRDIVSAVTYADESGILHTASGEELDFGYRHSCFEGRSCCIAEVTLVLSPCPPAEIEGKMADFMTRRKEKQPLEYGSAGSTFKRPEGNYASALIDQCGLKGMRIGGAEVSGKHAGFIINRGGATANDVLALIEKVKETVKEQTGYTLECEIKVIG